MSDTLILTGPNGSSINLASFILADPGWESGETDLFKAAYAENPAAEGAWLAFETVNHRTMTFPMRIASMSALGGAAGAAAWMRTLARPGATLDVLLDGVPTTDAVRFDVLSGRLEDGIWNTFQYTQTKRFDATLKIDVQPYGYWPTMILLASAASVGGPGVLSLNLGGSIFGDAPGLAELFVAPTSATSYGVAQKTEAVLWSFGARPSFQAFWPAGSMIAIASLAGLVPTLVGDLFAPGSQAIRYLPSSNTSFFSPIGLTAAAIPAALEPAYRGRYRFYAFARFGPSQQVPYIVTGDAAGGSYQFTAIGVAGGLGSAAPLATVPVSVASWSAAGGQGPSPAYSLVDLGEISLPLVASQANDLQLRVWGMPGSQGLSFVASTNIDIGGIYLQPLDGAAGILPRGLNQPSQNATSNVGFQGRLYQSAITKDTFIALPTSTVASLTPVANGLAYFRGVPPVVGASTIQLDLMLAGKRIQDGTPCSQPPIRSEPPYAQVSVRYRPRFAFLKGI